MRRLLLATAVLLVGAQLAPAQESQHSADSVMSLNRRGRWADAEVLAHRTLESNAPGEVAAVHCQLLESLLWAETRLRKSTNARATLAKYDTSCSRLQAMRGFAPEVARLRRELRAMPGAAGAE